MVRTLGRPTVGTQDRVISPQRVMRPTLTLAAWGGSKRRYGHYLVLASTARPTNEPPPAHQPRSPTSPAHGWTDRPATLKTTPLKVKHRAKAPAGYDLRRVGETVSTTPALRPPPRRAYPSDRSATASRQRGIRAVWPTGRFAP